MKTSMDHQGGYAQLPLDVVEPTEEVQLVIREDGRALWLNVDGRCVCRVGRIPESVSITIEDMRKEQQ